MTPIEQRLKIRNTRNHDLELHIEPWGDQFTLAPNAQIEIVVAAAASGTLELESTEARMTIYAWPGSTVAAYHQATELAAPCRIDAD